MKKEDVKPILAIGAGVGLLIQPVLTNLSGSFPAWLTLTPELRIDIFFFFIAFAPFALWIAGLIGKLVPGIYQFSKFAAVGVLNTFIDLGVLNLETFLYGAGVVGLVIFAVFKGISFLGATTNSFFWNKYWTFSATAKPHAKEVAGFYIVAVIGWVLNVAAATFVKATGPADSKLWTNLIAPLAGVAAAFLWDFFGFKHLVFKKEDPAPPVS